MPITRMTSLAGLYLVGFFVPVKPAAFRIESPPSLSRWAPGLETAGKATAGASRGRGLGCAEGVCFEGLGKPADVQFTPALRPRTGEAIPVCPKCEAAYGRGAFPDPSTRFGTDSGG